MKYTAEQLRMLQEVEYSILAEIIRVCESEKIPYFTVGGTTLGAIRHSAMIPWDDDIDIGMLRDDYEHFLKIAPQKLKSGFTLTYFATDKNAPTYFAKVR
jgi:lipopolysaccharide cholinephosphotransferase